MGVQCYAHRWLGQRRWPSSRGLCRPSEAYVKPPAALVSWWVPQCMACWLCSNSVLETLSSQEIPITLRRHRRWNWSSFFCISAKFHSHRAGTALCTCRLVPKVMPCSPHTRVHNLPKESPALASLFDTSLSMLQLVWSQCSPQVLEKLDLNVRLWRRKFWWGLQQHLCLLA